MDVIHLLALVAFLAAGIWAAISRAWPLALIAAGLFLLTLEMSGLINS
jgi:hypothetical protein